MGLFSDTCQAIIDPQTHKALTGEALIQARLDPNAPRCGHSVKKAARFCSKCGSGAPNGWWQCPSCGKWVGNDSQFCWNCSTPLFPETRGDLNGSVWSRSPGKFAQRFEVGDVKRLIKGGIQIQEGTVALLLDAGGYKGSIDAGNHDVDSIARKINHFGSPPPRTIVLIDSGLIALPIRIEKLRSAEELSVSYYGEVAVRFSQKYGKSFIANLLKEQRELSFESLAGMLTGAVRNVIENFCNTSTIEDIVKDPERRLRLEDMLEKSLRTFVSDYGIEIVRVSQAEFYGKSYEELRQKAEDLEVKRRNGEFDGKMRDLLTKERMGEFKSEHDLEYYVNQLAHERGISEEKRDHELAQLKQIHRHELDLEALRHVKEAEIQKAMTEVASSCIRDDYEIEKTDKWLQVKRKKKALAREDLIEMAKVLEGQSFENLISLVDDPEKREQLMELQRRTLIKGKSPEEILAMDAVHSSDAAEALSKLMAYKEKNLSEMMEKQEHLHKEHRDQLENLMKKALEAMGNAAKQAGSSTTINK